MKNKVFAVVISIIVPILLSGLFLTGCSNSVSNPGLNAEIIAENQGSETDASPGDNTFVNIDQEDNKSLSKWLCTVKGCKYVYDPEVGDPTQGIPPGTSFEELPPDWKCPVCKEGKDKFIELD
jgi:rubredoxin